MLFLEKKVENNYEYETEQFIGCFKFVCSEKIPSNILDALVLNLSKGLDVVGEVDYKGLHIKYEFKRNSLWEEDDEEVEEDLKVNK